MSNYIFKDKYIHKVLRNDNVRENGGYSTLLKCIEQKQLDWDRIFAFHGTKAIFMNKPMVVVIRKCLPPNYNDRPISF